MIVPRNRLLFWCALIGLPFSVIAAAYPPAALISVASMAVFVVVAAFDMVLAYGRLDQVEAQLPAVVRLTQDRNGSVEVKLKDGQGKGRRLRIGLAFPLEIQAPYEEQIVALPPGNGWFRLAWPCLARQRGRFRLNHLYLEEPSPLGFWAIRRAAPAESELRVYPNLLTERRNLAALFLHRGTVGLHAQRQTGKGRDFEKLREYVPGDSYEDIHWKATARRGHPVTKVFQIERTQEVYVVVDASRLSTRPAMAKPALAMGSALGRTQPAMEAADSTLEATETTALERFITAALVLGFAAEQQGDLFGLITFSDQVGTFLRARNGRAHYHACREALSTLQAQLVSPEFDEVATFIRLRLRRRALLIFLTALDDPVLAESFVRSMELLCRQHLVLVNMLNPPGAAPLFSQPDLSGPDDLYRHLGGHLQWQKLKELDKILQRRGIQFALLDHERLSAQLVSEYLNVKQRQLL